MRINDVTNFADIASFLTLMLFHKVV